MKGTENQKMAQRSRAFNLDDSRRFGEISDDHNPSHIDPVYARRTIFGGPVVHGINAFLWAIEATIPFAYQASRLRSAKARFNFPISLEQNITALLSKKASGDLDLKVETDDGIAINIHLSYFPPLGRTSNIEVSGEKICGTCHDKSLEALAEAHGEILLRLPHGKFTMMFPKLAQNMPQDQIAVFLAMTRLVGMECPGLNSIFSAFDIEFTRTPKVYDRLQYAVKKIDARFSRIAINLECDAVSGSITAFYRPSPAPQLAFDEVKRKFDDDIFAGQRALIIGGSRGLGEATAKLIAAGGGRVHITYHQGQKDAETLVRQIQHSGGNASSSRFDAASSLATISEQLSIGWDPTHLYYFATPRISLTDHLKFNADLFDEYCLFYVKTFYRIISDLMSRTGGPLSAFYPSTAALDDVVPRASEYASAKAAGEALCKHLDLMYPKLDMHIARLPRTITDQTNSIIQVDGAVPLDLMRPILSSLSKVSAPS